MSGAPARLILVGPLPPPVHGQAVATQALLDMLRARGIAPRVVDVGEGEAAHGALHRLRAHLAAARAIVTDGAPALYLSVNAHRGIVLTIALALLGRLRGKRLLLHHHCHRYIRNREAGVGLLARLAGARAAHIVNCRDMGAELAEAHPAAREIMSLSNMGVIEPGLAPLPLPDGPAVTLGHLSNLLPAKGSIKAIEAFRRLLDAGENVRMVVAGPCRDPAVTRAVEEAAHAWPDRFRYMGPVYGDEKRRFFEAIHVFAYPTFNDAQPLVTLEALACGRPVVATALCCIPGDIGDAGLAVAPDDDFAARLGLYLARYRADRAGASVAARARFDTLAAENAAELDALVARIAGRG